MLLKCYSGTSSYVGYGGDLQGQRSMHRGPTKAESTCVLQKGASEGVHFSHISWGLPQPGEGTPDQSHT